MAEKKPETTAGEAPPAAGGGLKAWLPLIVTLLAMPALAFGTMQFLILPKLHKGSGAKPAAEKATAEAETTQDGERESKGQEETAGQGNASAAPVGKGAHKVKLNKLVVNVAGTSGTRYLMASVVLVGTSSRFKDQIEENSDQLLDLANSTLSGKTIADLEKPGARNQIKIELISVFNNALGEPLVKEIFIPEMAIQ